MLNVEICLTLTKSFISTSKKFFLRNLIQETQYLIYQIYREGFQNGIYLYLFLPAQNERSEGC